MKNMARASKSGIQVIQLIRKDKMKLSILSQYPAHLNTVCLYLINTIFL